MWDKKEQKFPLKRGAEAMHFLFKDGESERGMAAVLLRYACLDFADAILEPTQKDSNAEKDLVQAAYGHLTAAKKLFDCDITNSLIVDGYFGICDIISKGFKDFSAALKICFDIGDTGRRTGNTCTSEFVGMLYIRPARRLASDEVRV